jgi:hypothetical protein
MGVTLSLVSTVLALSAHAADRARAGLWQGQVTIEGQTVTQTVCMSQADANAINGDAASVRAYVERVNGPAGCKVKDVQIAGNRVVATTICSGQTNVNTMTYHGDTMESETSDGVKSTSRWIGPCK